MHGRSQHSRVSHRFFRSSWSWRHFNHYEPNLPTRYNIFNPLLISIFILFKFPEEIARQLENSGARYIITIGLFLQNIKQACELYGNIDKIIVLGMEDKPDDCVGFIEMVLYEDGSLYDEKREFNVHEDIVALPYSSGTTGPPKGVSLTHYNMVANMCQMSHPQVTMLRDTNDELQECTVAVLPFFHIYAMNTIMTIGLQIGAKIVTVPRFEPEMYLKALVTYRVSFSDLIFKIR